MEIDFREEAIKAFIEELAQLQSIGDWQATRYMVQLAWMLLAALEEKQNIPLNKTTQ